MIIGRPLDDPEFISRLRAICNDFTSRSRRSGLRQRLWAKTDGKCIVCGKALGMRSVIGHGSSRETWAQTYLPLERAIECANREENLFLMHSGCNSKLGPLDIDEYLENPETALRKSAKLPEGRKAHPPTNYKAFTLWLTPQQRNKIERRADQLSERLTKRVSANDVIRMLIDGLITWK